MISIVILHQLLAKIAVLIMSNFSKFIIIANIMQL